ncbi:hypothetical protein SAMN05421878_1177 [Actinobaculum suis]|uniref:Uncharacterized protein n=1 Tax=Actinobaculum suis TaxID=1657 RepID=A0A0K9ESU6_9ACTO|nr:hypothetical protein [Actinobaculum suis]KMY23274.1 hypothetical protein ACU19_05250 [Actinobaculum suis]MDY5153710.1 hypothetical protein [Actinobaculum suis]OCA95351.1 hypothetical protein ACU20_04325 [Actinobaculum suis]OCA95936.1 hypothetical protein ACU21_02905 [Actinobaculum suis]SDE62065.1 hypothetical protein SAMN05421878_1177 [Actinobaculum suis]
MEGNRRGSREDAVRSLPGVIWALCLIILAKQFRENPEYASTSPLIFWLLVAGMGLALLGGGIALYLSEYDVREVVVLAIFALLTFVLLWLANTETMRLVVIVMAVVYTSFYSALARS